MPTVKLRGSKRPVVRAHGLRQVVKAAKGVRALGPSDDSDARATAARDLGVRLLEAGEFIASLARGYATWSSRVPASIRVGGGQSGVVVRAGGARAPAAYSNEIEGVQHPTFGHVPWVTNQFRPFMVPAAEDGAEEAALIVARVISDWAREYGFTE
jgi:hypothetical protein